MANLTSLPTELVIRCIALLPQPDCSALSAVNKQLHGIVESARYMSLELVNKSPSQMYSLVNVLSKHNIGDKIFHLDISYTKATQLCLDASIITFEDSARALHLVPKGSDTGMGFWRDTLFSNQCTMAFIAYLVLKAPKLLYLRIVLDDCKLWSTFVELVRCRQHATQSCAWNQLQKLELHLGEEATEPLLLFFPLEQVSFFTNIQKLVIRGSKAAMSLGMRLVEKGSLPGLKVLNLADPWWNQDTNDYARIPRVLAEKCTSLEELSLDFEYQTEMEDTTPWSATQTLTTLSSLKALTIHRDLLFERILHPTQFNELTSLLPLNLRNLSITGLSREELVIVFSDTAAKRELLRSLLMFENLQSCRLVIDFDIGLEEDFEFQFRIGPGWRRDLQRDATKTPLSFDVAGRRISQSNLKETSLTI